MVIVRLPYSLKIDAVTLEHIPAVMGGEEGHSSAPRSFRVLGYLPCRSDILGEERSEEDKECDRVGFDSTSFFDLGSYDYRLISGKPDKDGSDSGGRSIQTFDVSEAMANAIHGMSLHESKKDHDNDYQYESVEEEDEPEEEEDSGMCTVEKAAACGGPPADAEETTKGFVRAVALIVDDNWGTEEYTCIYRFRVHGEKIIE